MACLHEVDIFVGLGLRKGSRGYFALLFPLFFWHAENLLLVWVWVMCPHNKGQGPPPGWG